MYGSTSGSWQPDFYIDRVRRSDERRAAHAADEARRLREEEQREIERMQKIETETSH